MVKKLKLLTMSNRSQRTEQLLNQSRESFRMVRNLIIRFAGNRSITHNSLLFRGFIKINPLFTTIVDNFCYYIIKQYLCGNFLGGINETTKDYQIHNKQRECVTRQIFAGDW